MKNLFAALLALSLSSIAQAYQTPDDTHDLALAKMEVISTQGSLEEHPRFFDLVSYGTHTKGIEGLEINIPVGEHTPAFRSFDYKLVRKESAGCGSMKYVFIDARIDQPRKVTKTLLTLIDHRTRLCEDYRPYMWELTIDQASRLVHGKILGSVKAVGNPRDLPQYFNK